MGYRDPKKTPFFARRKGGLDTVVPSFFSQTKINFCRKKEGLDTVVPGMFGKAIPILFLYHFLNDFLYICPIYVPIMFPIYVPINSYITNGKFKFLIRQVVARK